MKYGFTIDVDGNSTQKIREIKSNLNDLGIKAEETVVKTNKLGSSLGGLKSIIGVAALGMFAKQFLTLGTSMEQTKISFEVFLGSAQKATQMIADMNTYANISPLANKDVYEGGKMLLGYGIAGDKVMDTLKLMGDASGGNAEKFQQMTYAYAQVTATGRLMGQDLLQLINAGFNPLGEIAKKTGKSVGYWKEEMEKGRVSAEMVTDAFKSATGEGGRFYGMIEKQSQSVGGLWSTVIGTMQVKMIQLFEAIAPIMKTILKGMLKVTELFTSTSTGAAIFRGVLLGLAVAVGAFAVGAGLATAAVWFFNLALWANPITWIVAAVAAFIAIIYVLWNTCKGFREFFVGLWGSIKAFFTGLGGIFKGLWHMIKGLLTVNGDMIAQGQREWSQYGDAVGRAWQNSINKYRVNHLFSKEEREKFAAGQMTVNGKTYYKQANGLWKEGTGGVTGNPLKENAEGTAALGGAAGGLGESKIINIRIDTMQKNEVKDGKDLINLGKDAIQILLRELNNLTYGQSTTM